MSLTLIHVELKEANAFISALHRHHKPVVGHRFSVGVQRLSEDGGSLVGVAICGRPVARALDSGVILEVTRLCTDGTKNVCSMLYSACARAAAALGYKQIQSYILDSESGVSLIASGWRLDRTTVGRQWTGTDGKARRTDQPTCDKHCYVRDL